MKKIKTTLILLCAILLFNGCAAIIHGSTQVVDIKSQPSGAAIFLDGQDMGDTPQSLVLNRNGRLKGDNSGKKFYQLEIEMEGYYPYEIVIKRDVDGWFFGNLLFGGIIGIIIDAASGSMYKLTPDQIIAQMGRVTVNNSIDDGLYINVALQVDPTWEKIGQLEKKL